MSSGNQANPKAHTTLLKVVIIGDGGVGKSSLMNRFVNNEFDSQSFHTIGVEFLNKDMTIDDETFTMQIWDTAGQERFKSLRTPFYRGSDCCILTFDVTDPHSFENIPMWKKEFVHYADIRDDKFPFVLLGNKVDSELRKVATAQAQEWCKVNGDMAYFETSAKDNIDVVKAFETAVRIVKERQPALRTDFTDTVKLNSKGSGGGCC